MGWVILAILFAASLLFTLALGRSSAAREEAQTIAFEIHQMERQFEDEEDRL